MGSLQGKVAIVTGGAAGIGAATSELLAERGASVVVADIDGAAAEAEARRIVDAGGRAIPVEVDVAQDDEVRAMVAAAVETYGRLDVLHNNAAAIGVARRDLGLLEIDAEIWDATFAVNVRGVFLGCRHGVEAMLRTGGGSIVNTSSHSALAGQIHLTAYSASKAAVSQLTRSVATQFGKRGIRCNAVAPGLTLSRSTASEVPQEVLDLFVDHAITPYGGQPEDIAAAVAFLASDEARYITGASLPVDGGILAGDPMAAGQRRMLAAAGDAAALPG
jgi:NAD(P)-dependent dehydrogenase (short-subunit alcohol dehydrogenase family)